MNWTFGIIIIITIVILFSVFILDRRLRAKDLGNDEYLLQVGYSLKLGMLIKLIILVTFILGFLSETGDHRFVFLLGGVLLMASLVFNGLQWKNQHAIFDNEKIVYSNWLGKKTEINFSELAQVKFGRGQSRLLLKGNTGKKIKIDWSLIGFKDLLEFVRSRNYI